MTTSIVNGLVAPGFEKVADAFADNFRNRGETGAACAVYADGQPAVDIWAGRTAHGRWSEGTRSVVFSVSKGITTICVLMAVEAGQLDLDAPVVAYWPEYGSHGKDTTTVRQLLAHRAGLPAPDTSLSAADLASWHPVANALAGQTPMWRPGSAFAYHPLTFGWLAGEVLRRATGLRPAQWFTQQIAAPLSLNATFGADPGATDVAAILDQLPDTAPDTGVMPVDPDLFDRAMTMGGALGAHGADLFQTANTPDFLSIEIPAGNLVSSAHDLARLYAATVGAVDGIRLLPPESVRDARKPVSWGQAYFGTDEGLRWGSGFMIDSARRQMLGGGSFGHDGAGGQLAFAHLEQGIGFGYQTIRPGGVPDIRAESLCDALRACL